MKNGLPPTRSTLPISPVLKDCLDLSIEHANSPVSGLKWSTTVTSLPALARTPGLRQSSTPL